MHTKNSSKRVIASDTDSLFFFYGDMLKKEGITEDQKINRCLETDETIKTVIESNLLRITNQMNSKNFYKFETEELYDKFLITSKKKYICRTAYDKNSKRKVQNQYNIKGMEFKKSNLSKPIKEILKNLTIRIMDGMSEEETLKEFKTFWKKILELPIDDIAYAQGLDGLEKYGSQIVS